MKKISLMNSENSVAYAKIKFSTDYDNEVPLNKKHQKVTDQKKFL